jgi:hypothetical protein
MRVKFLFQNIIFEKRIIKLILKKKFVIKKMEFF